MEEQTTAPSIDQMLAAMERWGTSDLFVCEHKAPAVRLHGQVVPLELAITTPEAMDTFLRQHIPEAAYARFQRTGDLDVGYTLGDSRRFRLNLAREQGRISLVARAIPTGDLQIENLGLPAAVGELARLQRGLILVTGATGSGKSTTLAALIHRINCERSVHIVTIEEPIEFIHEDRKARVTQREVGVDTASFEMALRQVLRESPDVILIGELRDLTTIHTALQAALTGHLVLASLHTIDAAQTLQRILSYFPEHNRSQVALDLSLSLRAIVSQRLIPRADGKGRAAAVELLTVGSAAGRLIREQRHDDLQDLMKGSVDPGVVPFDRSLLELYRAEVIDYATGVAYATNGEEFALATRGMSTGVATFRGSAQSVATRLDMQTLLRVMLERKASDLHLSVEQPPVFRIHGDLHPEASMGPLTATDLRILLYSILTVRQRGTYELERELDFSLALEDGQRFRVNAYYERGNMAAAFRAISSHIPDPSQLGLPPVVLEMGDEPQGLLLVVGPTGSGKTTTLACLIDRINRARDGHIMTVEDPIEYTHHSIKATVHQREVGADTVSFASALKYILRQDPDVVLVGELRDLETIGSAMTAAETGHLVLATLHTNDAAQTVDRLIDVFPPHQQGQVRSQLAACLLGVVSQRLLMRADQKGRVAAFEVLRGTPAIRTLIRENKMHQTISVMQSSRAVGMVTLDQALEDLVRRKQITKREALRYMRSAASISDIPDEG